MEAVEAARKGIRIAMDALRRAEDDSERSSDTLSDYFFGQIARAVVQLHTVQMHESLESPNREKHLLMY